MWREGAYDQRLFSLTTLMHLMPRGKVDRSKALAQSPMIACDFKWRVVAHLRDVNGKPAREADSNPDGA